MAKKHHSKQSIGFKPAVAALTLAVMQANYVIAEEFELQLEEVVVTATKRAVGMQDVPIAMSVMGGEKIQAQGAGNLEDISAFMPNVTITESSGSDQIYIRGIGSGENPGFEQSVGTFIDGVYFGRGKASRSAILDLERVEVLKGPQSTLFGKNTVAGALNITTAGPTDEFEAKVSASYEPEFDGWGVSAVVSGPLSETVNARLAVRHEETDGYYDNKLLNRDARQEEDNIARLTLDWMPTDDLSFRFKVEHGETDTDGRQNNIGIATSDALAIYRNAAYGGDPSFQAGVGYDKYTEDMPGRPSEFTDSDWDVYALTVNWDVAGFNIKSITSYTENFSEGYLDLDFGPLEMLGGHSMEESEQFTQEIIISSPVGDTLEYMAGVFYQKEDLTIRADVDTILSPLAAELPATVPGAIAAAVAGGAADSTVINHFDQESETLSAFAQFTWHIAEDFRIIAGLRYSDDEKEFEKISYTAAYNAISYTPYGEPLDILSQGIAEVLAGGNPVSVAHTFDSNGLQRCEYAGMVFGPATGPSCITAPSKDNKRSEHHWTGDIVFQYDLNEDAMTYFKYGTGYKAGGFDARNLTANFDSAEFNDESVESFELGAKFSLWDGRADVNVALFHNSFEDVQVSVFDGVAGFVVSNAGETTTKGIEVDGQLLLTENLYARYAVSWLDAKYDKYEGAACTAAQSAAFGPGCEQDLSGEDAKYSPEWSGNLGLEYRTPLNDLIELKAGIDLQYSSEYHNASDNDPVIQQDSFTKLNARIQLAGSDDTWSVALLGKNLTDEEIVTAPNDIPLGSTFGLDGSYFYFMAPPRSYEIQATYKF